MHPRSLAGRHRLTGRRAAARRHRGGATLAGAANRGVVSCCTHQPRPPSPLPAPCPGGNLDALGERLRVGLTTHQEQQLRNHQKVKTWTKVGRAWGGWGARGGARPRRPACAALLRATVPPPPPPAHATAPSHPCVSRVRTSICSARTLCLSPCTTRCTGAWPSSATRASSSVRARAAPLPAAWRAWEPSRARPHWWWWWGCGWSTRRASRPRPRSLPLRAEGQAVQDQGNQGTPCILHLDSLSKGACVLACMHAWPHCASL